MIVSTLEEESVRAHTIFVRISATIDSGTSPVGSPKNKSFQFESSSPLELLNHLTLGHHAPHCIWMARKIVVLLWQISHHSLSNNRYTGRMTLKRCCSELFDSQ